MKNDLLANRHIGISKKDEEQMLRKIGVSSLDELIDKTIPANIRLKEPLALPEAMTEYEFGQHIAERKYPSCEAHGRGLPEIGSFNRLPGLFFSFLCVEFTNKFYICR